jgi:AAA+ ATPase superfamily predicted ATPase
LYQFWKFQSWKFQYWNFQKWYYIGSVAEPAKPIDLLDRDREWAGLAELWASNKSELAFVLGRRRVGKSFLLSHFAREVGGLYYQATRRTEAEQLTTLSAVIGDRFEEAALRRGVSLPDWERLLGYLADRADGERFLIVLDEFPYLVDSAPALPSILQGWLDHASPQTRIKLVLSGSHITAMRQLEGADQPLYGRRTRRFVVAPFGVGDVGAFTPTYSPEDRLVAYGALGGLPGHLALLDPSKDIATNASALLLDPSGRLVDEAQHMLDAFLTDAVVHYSIIEAIATGDQTWKGITNRTGRAGGALHRAMDWLVGMEVVERVTPITEAKPERSKRTLYRISDPYVAFWHRFVSPLVAAGSVGLADPRRLWDTIVAPRLDDYMGGVFEQACRQAVRVGGLELQFSPVRVGEWWDARSREQLDVVALDGAGTLLAAECKWGEATSQDLATLERRASLLASELGGIRRTQVALFSSRGVFDSGVMAAKDAGRVLCFSAADMV